jgi:hypothetical protein
MGRSKQEMNSKKVFKFDRIENHTQFLNGSVKPPPGASAAATIRSFSARGQRRRR